MSVDFAGWSFAAFGACMPSVEEKAVYVYREEVEKIAPDLRGTPPLDELIRLFSTMQLIGPSRFLRILFLRLYRE